MTQSYGWNLQRLQHSRYNNDRADWPPLGIDRLDVCWVHDSWQCGVERCKATGDLAEEAGVCDQVLGTAVVGNTRYQNQTLTCLNAHAGVLHTHTHTRTRTRTHTHTHTHTHTAVERPFVQDYPDESVPEETFTHSHPWWRKGRIRTANNVHCTGAHPLYGALIQKGLLDPV